MATEKHFQELELALQQAQVEEEAANDFTRRSLKIHQELKAIKARAKAPVACSDESDHKTHPSTPSAVLPHSEEDLNCLVTGIVSKVVSLFHHFLKL